MDHIIRKISIGSDYKNEAMHYAIGQQVYGGHTISAILFENEDDSYNIHIKTAFQHTVRTSFFGLVKPKISIGTEIYPNKSYQLLTGISYGGVNKMTFGTGFRIKFKRPSRLKV